MRDQVLLILGGSQDGQLRRVVERIRRSDVPLAFLDHETTRDAALRIDQRGRGELVLEGVPLGAPALLWCRLKIRPVLSVWNADTTPEYLKRAEWKGFLEGVAFHFQDAALVSPAIVRAAEAQPLQFRAAAEAGFDVPASTLFVGVREAQDFVARYARSVAKPISVRNYPRLQGHPDSYDVLTTTAVDAARVPDAADALADCPSYFQQRLPAGVEYRVLAFRDRAYCYEVARRLEDKLRPDERMVVPNEYRGVGEQPSIAARTSRYLRIMGLAYGAFDVVETPDGRLFFLECNPEGQWSAANGINAEELADHFAEILIQEYRVRMKGPKAQLGLG